MNEENAVIGIKNSIVELETGLDTQKVSRKKAEQKMPKLKQQRNLNLWLNSPRNLKSSQEMETGD